MLVLLNTFIEIFIAGKKPYRIMGFYTSTVIGRLCSRQRGVGTLSEGPEYYIIPTGKYAHWGKILIRKKVQSWQSDPSLHPFVNLQVKIKAEITETKDTITIDYVSVVLLDTQD